MFHGKLKGNVLPQTFPARESLLLLSKKDREAFLSRREKEQNVPFFGRCFMEN
jgi:hypothetical protein